MRLLPTCIFLVAACVTIPAICQSSSQNNFQSSSPPSSRSNLISPAAGATGSTPAQPTETSTPPVSSSALRADIARQDKVIKNQIDTQENLRKKNKELMKQAEELDKQNKKLQAKNKKLEAKNRAFNAEKKNAEAQSADLAKKSDAIKAAERPIQTPAN